MKYLLIVPGYPSKDDIYNCVFVHSRVKCYINEGLDLDVFVLNNKKTNKYIYEGVSVQEGSLNELEQLMKKNRYQKILIHFVNYQHIDTILENRKGANLLVWVHGYEALGWYRRLFLLNIKKIPEFVYYIIKNTIQLKKMRKLIKQNQDIIKFIFVSEWMKNILETDTMTKGKIYNYEIIPNIINEEIFKYEKKDESMRYNVLSIRSYDSKKYANDISVKAVLELSKRKDFEKYNFTFFGKGKLFEKILKPIRNFNNVKIYEKFLTQDEMVEEHKKNGIFLVPTRQDAQGVSMCEAMSSGLVPVTSNNTAIPEYVNDKIGFLTNNYKQVADSIEKLSNDYNLFDKMSKSASKSIKNKCGKESVIRREIKLITDNEKKNK